MDLAAILRCPRCRGLLAHPTPDAWDCPTCRVRYPVREGIPDFTQDAAQPIRTAPPLP